MRLGRDFFARDAEVVAEALLGKMLVRDFGNGSVMRGIITETEAYVGEHDLASHARFGRRKRTEAMYGEPGTLYMFLNYGVHWMLNIVCSKKDDPQAVLVRGLDIATGPGRLTKLLKLDGSWYQEDLVKSNRLWIEEGEEGAKGIEILRTPRIGIDYAKEWKDKPLRFLLKSTKL